MGSFQAKEKNFNFNLPKERDVEALRAKVKLQKEEMEEIISMREIECQTYEQELMILVLKEAEWKRERKRLKDEVQKFMKQLEEREWKIKELMEDEEDKDTNEWKVLGNGYLMECMREERTRRDEAVDKWKRLYLEIKSELDHLIKMTRQEERMTWKPEEASLMDELNKELQAKEDIIKLLRKQLDSKEKENWRMERQADILKQNLRIMTHRKGKNNAKCLKKSVPQQK